MSDLGSETIIASGFQGDVAGQGKADSTAKHQRFLLKITKHPQNIIISSRLH